MIAGKFLHRLTLSATISPRRKNRHEQLFCSREIFFLLRPSRVHLGAHDESKSPPVFTASAGVVAAGIATPYFMSSSIAADTPKSDRHTIGCIGTGDRWKAVVKGAMQHGDVVAVCDVDKNHVEEANKIVGGKAEMFEDYRRVLDNKKIDVVTIVTTDHWHTKIAIDAMKAGKDVYCEKPLTLTIDEGKLINKVQKETGRVFQVGTQQRSEMSAKDETGFVHPTQFLKAVGLVQSGALGKIKKVHCFIGGVGASGSIPAAPVPTGLNWDMWLGQARTKNFVYAPGGRWASRAAIMNSVGGTNTAAASSPIGARITSISRPGQLAWTRAAQPTSFRSWPSTWSAQERHADAKRCLQRRG